MTTLTQPIKWHGGKHYLAKWIMQHMPKHVHYCEPYFGGGSVLLQKDPEGVSEWVNDINGPLTTFWAVLADDGMFAEFVRRVEATPFSGIEFANARAVIESATYEQCSADPVWMAVQFFTCARQSRQGLMKDFATPSKNRTRRGMNEQVSSWLTAIDGLHDVHARLKRVVIQNKPAVDFICQQDGPSTLFYCDPPYLHETRVTTSDYAHEMTLEDHASLLRTLTAIEGKFLLSGYPSTLYEKHRQYYGWHVVSKQIDNKASSKKTKERKTECLWANFDLEAVARERAA